MLMFWVEMMMESSSAARSAARVRRMRLIEETEGGFEHTAAIQADFFSDSKDE